MYMKDAHSAFNLLKHVSCCLACFFKQLLLYGLQVLPKCNKQLPIIKTPAITCRNKNF